MCDQLLPDIEGLEPDSKKPRHNDVDEGSTAMTAFDEDAFAGALEEWFDDPHRTPRPSDWDCQSPQPELPEQEIPDDWLGLPPDAAAEEPVVAPPPPAPDAAAAEPVPPPPPPLAGPGAERGDRMRHIQYDVDARGDGQSFLKLDTKLNILAAHCRHPDHGNKCRMNKTLKARASKPAQGRPIGFLIAWLQCAGDFESQQLHSASNSFLNALVDPRYDFANRSRARADVKDHFLDWQELFALECGALRTEPEELP